METKATAVVHGARRADVRTLVAEAARVWGLRGRIRGGRIVLEGEARRVERAVRALRGRGVDVIEGVLAEAERLAILSEDSIDTAEALMAAREVADRISEIATTVSRAMVEDVQEAYQRLVGVLDPDDADAWREAVSSSLERVLEAVMEAQKAAAEATRRIAAEVDMEAPGAEDGEAAEPFGAMAPAGPRDEEEVFPDFDITGGRARPARDAAEEPEPDVEIAGAAEEEAERGGEEDEEVEESLHEAWGVETRPPPSESGKYAGATLDTLCRLYRRYRRWSEKGEGRRPTWKGEPLDVRELLFAIRAKSGKYRWGSAKRICGIAESADPVRDGRASLEEAWGVETRPPPSERGKYADATLEELCRRYRRYRRWRREGGRRPTWKGEPLDVRELLFAIRAKSGKYRWGSAKRICGIAESADPVRDGRASLEEAWGVETRPPPSERGKYADATLEELCRRYRRYRRWRREGGRRPTWKGEPLDVRELLFAIRAKSGKYRWGSAKRICGIGED